MIDISIVVDFGVYGEVFWGNGEVFWGDGEVFWGDGEVLTRAVFDFWVKTSVYANG